MGGEERAEGRNRGEGAGKRKVMRGRVGGVGKKVGTSEVRGESC